MKFLDVVRYLQALAQKSGARSVGIQLSLRKDVIVEFSTDRIGGGFTQGHVLTVSQLASLRDEEVADQRVEQMVEDFRRAARLGGEGESNEN